MMLVMRISDEQKDRHASVTA